MIKKFLGIVGIVSYLFSACSEFIGGLTINEVYIDGSDSFIEVKILDDSINDENLSAWKVITTTSDGQVVHEGLDSCNDDEYRQVSIDSSEIDAQNGSNVVVIDDKGAVVDYFKITNNEKNETAEKCSYDYDIDSDEVTSKNNFDYYRDPDGTGDWLLTECGENQGVLGNIMCMFGIESADNSECSDNNNNPIIVNDDDVGM